jgi:uncharacterized protein (TIGR03083 family)
VETTDLIDHLAAEGTLLGAATERAGWDAAVPHLDWTVRDVVVHLGGVHRWAADVVSTASPVLETEAYRAVGAGPPDGELLDWFLVGHTALVTALSEASPDLDVVTFLRAGSPLEFWARRQAHETTVHRVDVETAAGVGPSPIDDAVAWDGIREVLGGFAARRSNAIARKASLLLAPGDDTTCVRLEFGGERIEATDHDTPPPSDATVRGAPADLYLWLWNRPCGAQVEGDLSVAQLWRDTVRVRWS